ncbi:hypothetical protein OZL92_20965 [Bacillus sonorensis]|uniref:Uncharacterized protein n=2 Tax=Bacillus sonorensis TaxID=119858 RepID=M5P9U7_9BACI|nr:hypothetical protein [Bacillus sonorensis]ASB90437.1 hypothetical protein S101395_03933 [Bacillus sonorensis]EME76223.1 hypothetical protein BSONL12_04604 [Bacillus sonorensis L12]MCZ0074691.1 hypothetical protein [Bacillus sonorensis]MCZ0093799.1 hypothetical protein [Bacillus sonorensis]PAD61866.1 hypothetical protein CHH92_02070 [Bacillus sonorensis]
MGEKLTVKLTASDDYEKQFDEMRSQLNAVLNAVEFVVMIVDTPDQARIIESVFKDIDNDRMHFRALAVGQAAVGWQFKGTRPTTVILAYSELKTDQEKKWEREVVNNLGYRNDHPTRQTKWVSLL